MLFDTVCTIRILSWSVKQFVQENIKYNPQLADQALGSLTAGYSIPPRRELLYLSSYYVLKSRMGSSALEFLPLPFPLEF